jgi:hypothetical protein
MSTFLERLIIERDELNEKKEKLTAFIGTESFQKVAVVQQRLLKVQQTIMCSYLQVLDERIADLEWSVKLEAALP